MKKSPGRVYLVGAGPGDLEYLTLKAIRYLQQADVVLLDSLVNPAIVKYLREGTKVIPVGKRGGGPSTPQAEISALMLELTQQGLCVARVKGGDPFVFGRAGEEMALLQAAGVHVDVCSGISSGLAIPSALGIPLTHRDLAHSFVFITGTHKDDTPPVAWEALVRSKSTIVVFMALANLTEVTGNLIGAGMDGSTPTAAVQDGTLPSQKIIFAPLSKLDTQVKLAGLSSPTLVVIGEVVALSPAWLQSALNNAGMGLIQSAFKRSSQSLPNGLPESSGANSSAASTARGNQ